MPSVTNLTEAGAFGRNLLTRRWAVYNKEELVIRNIIQPKEALKNIICLSRKPKWIFKRAISFFNKLRKGKFWGYYHSFFDKYGHTVGSFFYNLGFLDNHKTLFLNAKVYKINDYKKIKEIENKLKNVKLCKVHTLLLCQFIHFCNEKINKD